MNNYDLRTTKEFERRLKKVLKKTPVLQAKISETLRQLADNPFFALLKTHKADTRLYGIRFSSSVTNDLRIIWDFGKDENTIILLLTIGGHSGKNKVYK